MPFVFSANPLPANSKRIFFQKANSGLLQEPNFQEISLAHAFVVNFRFTHRSGALGLGRLGALVLIHFAKPKTKAPKRPSPNAPDRCVNLKLTTKAWASEISRRFHLPMLLLLTL